MRLYVDDLRDPPDDTWTVARSSAEALAILRSEAVVEESVSYTHLTLPTIYSV